MERTVVVETPAQAVDRRRFLNRTMIGALGVLGAALGAGSIAVLWPEVRQDRFGSKINAGRLDDVRTMIEREGRLYHPVGKFYIVAYDTTDPDNRYVTAGVATDGLMALYQKCSHLGCRTPYCATSGFFECPCHGALFNAAGEHRGGPAPAGLWRFPVEIEDGFVIVDTKQPVAQPPRGTDTTGQEPAGAHCLQDVRVDP